MGYNVMIQTSNLELRNEVNDAQVKYICATLEDDCWFEDAELVGSRIAVSYYGKLCYDMKDTLKLLSQYFVEGSYVHFAGEDGAHFRYIFKDRDVEEERARIVWS